MKVKVGSDLELDLCGRSWVDSVYRGWEVEEAKYINFGFWPGCIKC